jgi:hypothetical protein
MAAHEAPQAVHDHIAADHARRTALQLHDQLSAMAAQPGPFNIHELLDWAGHADVILMELARG